MAAIALLEFAAVELAAAVMVTVRAQKPIGPSPLKQGVKALVFGAVEREEFIDASAVPKMRVNGRGEDVIFFDGVFFKSSLKSIFFVS